MLTAELRLRLAAASRPSTHRAYIEAWCAGRGYRPHVAALHNWAGAAYYLRQCGDVGLRCLTDALDATYPTR